MTTTKPLHVSITTRTRDKVAAVLQEGGLGRGLTVPQIRERYPAGAVRRTSILEALADLEAMGRAEWRGDRVRWTGPLEVERVFGEPVRRVERDRRLAPGERLARALELSEQLRPVAGAR
jgi:DNA-binding FadR family transcriptional regulator